MSLRILVSIENEMCACFSTSFRLIRSQGQRPSPLLRLKFHIRPRNPTAWYSRMLLDTTTATWYCLKSCDINVRKSLDNVTHLKQHSNIHSLLAKDIARHMRYRRSSHCLQQTVVCCSLSKIPSYRSMVRIAATLEAS